MKRKSAACAERSIRTGRSLSCLTHQKRHAPKYATNPQAHESTRQAALPFCPSLLLLCSSLLCIKESFASVPPCNAGAGRYHLQILCSTKLSVTVSQSLSAWWRVHHPARKVPSLSFTSPLSRRLLFASCLIMHRSVPFSQIFCLTRFTSIVNSLVNYHYHDEMPEQQ